MITKEASKNLAAMLATHTECPACEVHIQPIVTDEVFILHCSYLEGKLYELNHIYKQCPNCGTQWGE